jgi:cytochrome P450
MTVKAIDELPGPRSWPLIGNALQARPDRLHAVTERWCDRYGPLFRIDLGPRRVMVVADLDTINEILRDRPDGFRRWSELDQITDETGFTGVFAAEGEAWRRSRRLVVTALNSNHLQRYFHVVHTATERLHGRLHEAAISGRELDITDELTSFSVDVTSALAFGHDLNTLERRDNALQGHIQTAFATIARRVFFPVPYWRWVKRPSDRAYDRSIAELRRAVEGFIAQARDRVAANPELRDKPENFLESMVVAQETDDAFTDEEIIGNTFTLLLAGEDTTAHTMAWTLWLLARAPDVQGRWAAEAREVLGDAPFPADYETVSKFTYGDAVLREAMRLKAVAPGLFVEALHDTEVAGVRVPAATKLILLTRHASIASEPTLDRFDPARQQPDQKAFLGFGAGPRFCPGRNLAFLESTSAMAMIARNFEVTLDPAGGPVSEHLSFTMVPQGLRVRLSARSGARSSSTRRVRAC